jgi:hypothetical protein
LEFHAIVSNPQSSDRWMQARAEFELQLVATIKSEFKYQRQT